MLTNLVFQKGWGTKGDVYHYEATHGDPLLPFFTVARRVIRRFPISSHVSRTTLTLSFLTNVLFRNPNGIRHAWTARIAHFDTPQPLFLT
jgi:hypothetical protein